MKLSMTSDFNKRLTKNSSFEESAYLEFIASAFLQAPFPRSTYPSTPKSTSKSTPKSTSKSIPKSTSPHCSDSESLLSSLYDSVNAGARKAMRNKVGGVMCTRGDV